MAQFMQSTLTRKEVKPNRRLRKISNGTSEKRAGRLAGMLRPSLSDNPITDGQTPRYGSRKKGGTASPSISLQGITPWKLILTSFLIGICGLLYITHVFSTQQLLQEVQQLENEFNRTNRVHAETRLAYDRMVGPKEIYQRARQEGFVNAGPADRVIKLK